MAPESDSSKLLSIFRDHERELLADWTATLLADRGKRASLIKESELREQSAELLRLMRQALTEGGAAMPTGPMWQPVLELLGDISKHRGQHGFTPSETAMFIFSLKAPIMGQLRGAHGANAAALFDDVNVVGRIIDRLGLYTTEVHQKAREDVIVRQQQEMMELSTPVVKLWDGILALPLIGTLDSGRTQVVMESLLQRIVETNSPIAILDITGVPTVDTLTAQHLLKTVSAARLMGADCIISGVRPQIAQTIVHLGVDLGDIATKSSLSDAFKLALRKLGHQIVKIEAAV